MIPSSFSICDKKLMTLQLLSFPNLMSLYVCMYTIWLLIIELQLGYKVKKSVIVRSWVIGYNEGDVVLILISYWL